MTRKTKWTAAGVVLTVILLAGAALPIFNTVTVRCPKSHTAQVKQVGLALKLYADDHQGMLPHRLEDLMPVYFTDRRLLEYVEFLAPDEKLPDLPASAALARRTYREDNLVGVVHADNSAEARRP